MRRILFTLMVLCGIALLSGCEVPTGFSVNSTVDAVDAVPGDGVCETAVEDQCTLRAAILEANALGTPVTIELEAGATYASLVCCTNEDAGLSQDFDVTGDVAIVGNGALVKSGNDRVFDNHGELRIDDLRIQTSGLVRGPVRNFGTAVLTDTDIGGIWDADGAVQQVTGVVSLTRVNISSNGYARIGLEVDGGHAIVVDSSIHHIGGLFTPFGRAIDQSGGELLVVNSTVGASSFSGVVTRCDHLGVCQDVPFTTEGDGLVQAGGSATFLRSTVVGNRLGIDAAGTVVLHGTAVANNSDADCSALATSQGLNLDEDGTCVDGSIAGDLPATDALLGELLNSAAPTASVTPPAGSPLVDAIPAGTAYLCDGQHPVDQRGLLRPAGPGCDIGAIERQPSDP